MRGFVSGDQDIRYGLLASSYKPSCNLIANHSFLDIRIPCESNAYAHYRINNATTGWGNTDTGTLMSSMLNKWMYTTWTFNNGTTKIYINGVLSHTDTSRGAYNGGSDSPIYIGARNDLWGSINGYIDLVSYHNRALTDAEILKNFNSQRSRYSVQIYKEFKLCQTSS